MPYRYADGYHHREARRKCQYRNNTDSTNGPYMVDGVHGNTTSLWPRVALDGEFMLSTRSLCVFVSRYSLNLSMVSIHILNSGLSVRPPPATMPIMPRTVLLTTFFAPL